MQKKIIVLALAAVFSTSAFAADTIVYGVVDVTAANITAAGTKSDLSIHSGGLASSRLGVKSSEDLGGGLKASVVLEYTLDVTDSTSIGSARQEFVAVDGSFGKVAAGYLQTTGYNFGRFDPTAGSLITPLGNITKTVFLIGNNGLQKRMPRTIEYTSPSFGGVTIAANYSTAGTTGTTNLGTASTSTTEKGTSYQVSANYTEGPLAAALVYANKTDAIASPATTAVKTTETAIGASYDLGMAKLFATYQINKNDSVASGDTDKVMSVSASAPFGAHTVIATYAKATMTAQGADKDASGYTLAYMNSMTKATTFYAAYSAMSQGTATKGYSVANGAVVTSPNNMDNGANSTMVAVGLNTKF